MASLIPGYNYDIFISYRQKDNKHDGWVTEFVDNLKGELESTFKEEISVYFDINPHDGLLETHDVDASLKDKLKCLVFIPIISRTYCDPKSFAWEHEFKSFVEQASKDQFGLKIKLPNGNVANRVLPLRIHDLDNEDIKLCESVLGGVLRGIEFIYKEQGVNRPLKSRDNQERNLNNTNYHNQINKIALALRDIFIGLRTENSVPSEEMTIQNELNETIKTHGRKSYYFRSLKASNGKLNRLTSLSLVGFSVMVIISILIFWFINSSGELSVQRFIHYLPQGENIGGENSGSSVAISPDGFKLIFVSHRNDTNFLFLRMIDDFEAKPIPGTEGAVTPFFSPDSRWVAFFSDGKLKKVSILGGAPQFICEARSGYEGFWGNDNFIIYSDFYKGCLMRVPSGGGMPQQLTTALKLAVGEGEHSHLLPQILPGGNILFTIWHNNEDMRIVVYSPAEGKRWNIIGPGSHARYLKTGHIIYAWKGDLLTVPFNIKKMEVTGQPIVILKGVLMNNYGVAQFSISEKGSLAYIPGNINKSESILAMVNNNGVSKSLNIPAYQSLQLSPDGKQVLFEWNQGLANLWIYELERNILRRFTDKEYEAFWGIWTPDGKRIVFNSNMNGGSVCTLFWKMADGTGPTEKLIPGSFHQQPKCWADSGRLLIYTEGINPKTGMDILSIHLQEDTIQKPLFNSRFNETHPELSPNERWLAYVSDESGKEEVYLCSFPDLRNKVQISTDGGMEPLWSPKGNELYYRDVTGDKLMAVSFIAEKDLQIGKPRFLFQGKFKGSTGPWGRNYDIAADGNMFLMIEEGRMASEATQINVVLNWTEELKRIGKASDISNSKLINY